MRKILILFFATFFYFNLDSQVIDNTISLYLGSSSGGFFGGNTINEEGYISPSLFTGYKSFKGNAAIILYKMNDRLSIGGGVDYYTASDWVSPDFDDYNDSRLTSYALSAAFRIHNKFSDSGIMNRLSYSFDVSPETGFSNLRLINSLYDIENNGSLLSNKNSTDMFYGLKTGICIECAIVQPAGIFINCSFRYDRIGSKLYNDSQIVGYMVNFGVVLRLGNDKYFFFK